MQKILQKEKKISLIHQQIEYMKNINNNINTQNNIYDNNSKYIYKKNENDNRNNWGKIPYEKKTIIENINDNTNDIYRSLTT